MSTPLPAAAADRTGAAGQRVAAHLREAILNGDIGPGERIRQEDVAARLGGSRLPVREALRILAAEGLVQHEVHKGARVPVRDMHEVDVLYRMRESLEPLALAESLPRLSPEHLRRLDDLQRRIEADPDLRGFLALDREFHLLSYSGCDTDALLSTVTRLWNATQYYRRAYMMISGPDRRWVVNAEHRLLLDAITRRDEVDAGGHLRGHIRRTRVELSRHPEVFAGTAN